MASAAVTQPEMSGDVPARTPEVLARPGGVPAPGPQDGMVTAIPSRSVGLARKRPVRRRPLPFVHLVAVGAAAVGVLTVDVGWTGSAFADRLLVAVWLLVVVHGAARRQIAAVVAMGVLAAASTGEPAGAAIALGGVGPALVIRRLRPGAGTAVAQAVGAAIAGIVLLTGTQFGAAPAAAVGVAATGLAVIGRATQPRPRTRRRLTLVGFGALVVLAVWGVLLLQAKRDVEVGLESLRRARIAIEAGDLRSASDALGDARTRFDDAERRLGSPLLAPAAFVPVIGPNLTVVRELGAGAASLGAAGERLARVVDEPGGVFTDGRINLEKLHRLEAVAADVRAATADVQAVLGAPRSPWLVAPLVDAMDDAAAEIDAADTALRQVHDALRVAPMALGEAGEKRYLVLFTTPVEARGRTGFPGNWAELVAQDGRLSMVRFGRHTDIDATGVRPSDRRIDGPAEYLARYGRFLPAENLRSVPLSPDGPTVAAVMSELFAQSGGRPLDGVLTVDPRGIAALLALTGPVEVDGFPEAIGATNAADVLLRRQYLEFDNPDRIDFLAEAGRATFDRLVATDLPDIATVIRTLRDAAVKRHLQMVSFDPEVATVLAEADIDSAVPPVSGDDVMVITNNAVGNKIDLFLRRELDYAVVWDPVTGSLHGRLAITLHNDAPASGLPDVIIGSSITGDARPPSGTNRTWLSVYSPWIAESLIIDGALTPWQSEREHGRWVSSVFLDIGPGEHRTVVLEWSGALPPSESYVLTLRAQPLANPDTATTSVWSAGADVPIVETLVLDRDRSVRVEPSALPR